MHSYRYLPFKTLLPLSNVVLGHDHASYPITQQVVWLCNGPSGYASGQGLGIRAEHIHCDCDIMCHATGSLQGLCKTYYAGIKRKNEVIPT